MVKRVLTRAGFVENETFRETLFLRSPKTTYAIFNISYESRGADYCNLIKDHDDTIELYSYVADPDAESRVEEALDYFGLEYDKEERYWIQEEQLYQVAYHINHVEK